jgi:hypothetical protein
VAEVQYVDEAVSRRKFDRELAAYQILQPDYRKRGWILAKAEFPVVEVVFGTPKTRPPAIVCAVRLDFTNYDLVPPSVTFVDPFSGTPLPAKALGGFAMSKLLGMEGATPETVTARLQSGATVQPLLQAHRPEDVPFLCLPGVREYHDHPAHTGDSWLLHRRSGEGSLHFILEQIWASGVNPIRDINYQVQVSVMGFRQDLTLLPR